MHIAEGRVRKGDGRLSREKKLQSGKSNVVRMMSSATYHFFYMNAGEGQGGKGKTGIGMSWCNRRAAPRQNLKQK